MDLVSGYESEGNGVEEEVHRKRPLPSPHEGNDDMDFVVNDVSDEDDSEEDGDEDEVASSSDDDSVHMKVVNNRKLASDLRYIAEMMVQPAPATSADIEVPLPVTASVENLGPVKEEKESELSSESDEKSYDDDQMDVPSDDDSSDDEDEAMDSLPRRRKNNPDAMTEEEADGLPQGPIRTKHEVVEEEVTLPTVRQVTSALTLIGDVLYHIPHECTIVVQAHHTMNPLNEQSLLCNVDGLVLGVIHEVFGPINTPFYIVRYRDHHKEKPSKLKKDTTKEDKSLLEATAESETTAERGEPEKEVDIESAADASPVEEPLDHVSVFAVHSKVFAVPSHAQFITTTQIRLWKTKGSDASNAFDEEPMDDELEYSDDEQEQLAKQARKRAQRQTNSGTTANLDGLPSDMRAAATAAFGSNHRTKEKRNRSAETHTHVPPSSSASATAIYQQAGPMPPQHEPYYSPPLPGQPYYGAAPVHGAGYSLYPSSSSAPQYGHQAYPASYGQPYPQPYAHPQYPVPHPHAPYGTVPPQMPWAGMHSNPAFMSNPPLPPNGLPTYHYQPLQPQSNDPTRKN